MPSDIEIAKVINQWKYGECIIEVTDEFILEVAANFDHDYEFHILFYEHDQDRTSMSANGFTYSFWFLGHEGVTFIKRWEQGFVPPYVECAQIAQEWREMSVQYSKMEFGE